MRIDAYMQVNQVYNSGKLNKNDKKVAHKTSDSLEISNFGKDYHIAKQAVKDVSDVREDKVQMFKEQLNAGTYNVSIEDIANSLANRLIG
ncbi:MAG: flagellar biosynthesis anti-sigma factor FlgM [Lachnoclostridium sp.]|jgi:negative regulator of flagellin synthesis FlgM|nr:flagellar biosynthesis anti-sigma factor FlgM [Lachnoclostridium sp.]